jgi:hypothetical protein
MPLSYINPVFNNNITTETETLSVTGITTLGDNSADTVIINAKTISIPNDLNINNDNFFIKNSNSRIGINTITPSQTLDVNGNMIVSGFFGIGTISPSYKFHIVNTVAQGQNSPFVIEDNGTLTYYPNMTAALLNPAVTLSDKGIIATNGTINTGSLFIGTWSNNTGGAGIKVNSTGVNMYGNTIIGNNNTNTITINAGQINAVIPNGTTTPYPGFLCRGWVNFDGTSAANISGTYSQSDTTVTVTLADHGLLQGHVIFADVTSGTGVNGAYTVTSVTSTSVFTYTATTSLTTSGNITLLRRTIRGGGNISSVTYNNTLGDYTINFATAMPDVNYATIATGGGTGSGFLAREGSELIKTVNAVRIFTATQVSGTTAAADLAQINVTFFR